MCLLLILVRMIHYTFTHLHLVSRLRVSGVAPLMPSMPSWHGTGKFTFYMIPAYVLVADGSVNFFKIVNVHLVYF
jgi:hypothetical protein